MRVRAPLDLARFVRGFIVELAGFRRANVDALDMIEWLALVEASNPGVRAKIARMRRVMVGRDDGTEARVTGALDAVEYAFGVVVQGPAWGSLLDYVAQCDLEGREPTRAQVHYVNALHQVGLTDCMGRVTHDLAVTLARAMAKGRGRPKGGASLRDKHEAIAEALSTLLDNDVSRNTVEKCLKMGRTKKRS